MKRIIWYAVLSVLCLASYGCGVHGKVYVKPDKVSDGWNKRAQDGSRWVYEVRIDGVDYLVAENLKGICIIPKVQSKTEKE